MTGNRWQLKLAAGVTLLLATIGSFGAGFGILTACTNTYSCTETHCDPCAQAGTYLNIGWAGQGILLALTVAALLLSKRWSEKRTRTVGWVLAGTSILLYITTVSAAQSSF